jgi:hypothetical protein
VLLSFSRMGGINMNPMNMWMLTSRACARP